jgi:molybdate transport system substrate-binding protein
MELHPSRITARDRMAAGCALGAATTLLAGLAFFPAHARAQGAPALTVLSAGAVEPGLVAAVAAFQRDTGRTVTVTFNTAPEIRARIDGGEVFSVLVAPPAVLGELAKTGKLGAERADLGRVGLGVAVRDGAPVPDIASADALRQSVLAAESLVFNRASTGIYFEGLLKKIGIYAQVEPKTTRYADGEAVFEHVLKGKGREIGVGAITEILLFREKGLRFVGPLPADVQNYTAYVAAPMTGGAGAEAARTLVAFLGSPSGKAHFTAAGIE